MPNLLVLAGVPGSGKSTWAKNFFDLKYKVVSSDAIRKKLAPTLKAAHEQQIKPWDQFYEDIGFHLDHGVDVIADATFLTRRHRLQALETGWNYKAKCHLVLFKNVVEASTRNAQRDDDSRVPENVMADMMRLYYDTLAEVIQESWDTVLKIESYR